MISSQNRVHNLVKYQPLLVFNTNPSEWAPGQPFLSVSACISQLSAMQIDSILMTLTPKWMSNMQTHFVCKQTTLIPVNKSNIKSAPNGIKGEWVIHSANLIYESNQVLLIQTRSYEFLMKPINHINFLSY